MLYSMLFSANVKSLRATEAFSSFDLIRSNNNNNNNNVVSLFIKIIAQNLHNNFEF
jgi:hypothetical protein